MYVVDYINTANYNYNYSIIIIGAEVLKIGNIS